MRATVRRWMAIAVVALLTGPAAAYAAAQDNGNAAAPGSGIGRVTRHGLAGLVRSIHGSEIAMEIPENVMFTVRMSPSTRITASGQEATAGDIHAGGAIFASGEIDEEALTIEAVAVTVQDERAAQMLGILSRNFGKTWTAGIITVVQGDGVTVKRMDGQLQTFSVDQGTTYRLRDQQATFSMVRAGERIRAQLRAGGPVARHVAIQGIPRNP